MSSIPLASLKLEIDHDALAANWRRLDQMSGKARAGAAVKADCYGLGVDDCVPVLRDCGVRDFFVAHWSEVEPVAAHISPQQIAVLHGPMSARDARYARARGVVPVINSLFQAKIWIESGKGACDLMVDSGINRLGISPEEVGDPLVGALEVRCLMSHLACADEDSAMNARQLEILRSIAPMVGHDRVSFANSAGIALGADYAFDLTRPGLALYGGIPRGEFAGVIRPVARPKAAILQVRHLKTGDSVGYNASFTASGDMRVGVVSLGYADGFLRCWSDGYLLHGDQRLALLGKVSMDMVVVDLSQADKLREGDWVEVPYGSLPQASAMTGLSQYELLTVLGQRLRA